LLYWSTCHINPEYPRKRVTEGVGFDGSSYGFSKVENSDMILIPDLSTAETRFEYRPPDATANPYFIHFLPRNMDEALDALEVDQDFLKRGGVFSKELIDQWVGLKEKEIRSIGTMPHPFEYKLYSNL